MLRTGRHVAQVRVSLLGDAEPQPYFPLHENQLRPVLAAVEPVGAGITGSCKVVGAEGLFDSDYGAALADCSCQAWETASQVVGLSSRDDGSDDGQRVAVIGLEVIACSAKVDLGPEESHEHLHE